MKWFQSAKGEASWQGVSIGDWGKKREKLVAGVLLCVSDSTV